MEDDKLIIYKNSEGNIIVDAIYKDETLWLSQKGMSKVFDVGVPAISKHLKNIFEENELDKNSVVSKMEITAPDGKNYNTEVYSLDAIIAVGYRVNSKKEHIGLTNWKYSPDGLIYKYDVIIAKNYLNEEEMNNLKDLTNMFLVFAEDEAKQRHVMTMKDWITATDDLLKFRRKEILNNSGSVSHKEAVEKAEKEYEKFRVIQDQKYISSMDEFYNKYLNENSDNE